MQVHPLLAPLVDLVFPPRCPLCGDGLAAQTGLCTACWSELAIPGAPCCTACQRPLDPTSADGMVCAPCLASPSRHSGIAAATLYNEASRKLVLALKYGRRIALAPMLARLIAAQLPADMGPDWIVVPVPLHRWRLWSRGFNQSALLARELATPRSAQLAVDALIRRKRTPTLGGLGRKARIRALSGAIAVNPRWQRQLKGAKVLLVDDVLTSGATTEACLAVLKRAGAERVVIACFARVLDEALDHARKTKTPGTEAPGVLVTKLSRRCFRNSMAPPLGHLVRSLMRLAVPEPGPLLSAALQSPKGQGKGSAKRSQYSF